MRWRDHSEERSEQRRGEDHPRGGRRIADALAVRLLAIIAGASRWPQCESLESNRSFSRSAELVAEQFLSPDGLHLRRAEMFFVFDDDRGADELDERLGKWLDERLD